MLKHFAGFKNVFYNRTKSVVGRPSAKGDTIETSFPSFFGVISDNPVTFFASFICFLFLILLFLPDLAPSVIESIKRYVQYDLALYEEGKRIFEAQKRKIGRNRLRMEVEQFRKDLEFYHQRSNTSCVDCYSATTAAAVATTETRETDQLSQQRSNRPD